MQFRVLEFYIFIVLIRMFFTLGIRYEPNWESLDKRPLPTWYDEAKIGIFLHWGVYSVPSFGSEWFWTNWINKKNLLYVNFMLNNYKPNFSYQEFAKDFTAELFNATLWASLFSKSGSRYVVLTSKHHDGFTLWPSQESFSWNALDIGPRRDLVKEISTAVRAQGNMKFGVYYSLFEWFNRMYIDDKLHIFLKQNYIERKVQPELIELVTRYKPDVIWSDGDWEAPSKYWKSEEFIAWLYNDSPVRETVVTNDRWGFGTGCKHGDFFNCVDRFNPGVLQLHKWENAFTLDKTSWGQRFDTMLSDYITAEELIKEIVTTVSCNGNVLINIGPTKYGTILPIFQERLIDMGKWLDVNGEAIYASKPWIYQNDSITSGVWYTCKQNNADELHVYAIILEYPYTTNEIDLHLFGKRNLYNTDILLAGLDSFQQKKNLISILLLGMSETSIEWTYNNDAIHVILPPKNHIDKKGLELAWTLKIVINK